MRLTQLAYVSSYVNEYGLDLPDFIEAFVLAHVESAVEGMTLFAKGNIIQLLEGDYRAVNDVFEKLTNKGKQLGALELLHIPIEHRCLSETSIGYRKHDLKSISKSPQKIALFELHPTEVDRRILEGPGKVLMMQFAADFGQN